MHKSMSELLVWIESNRLRPVPSAFFVLEYLINHGSAEEYPLVPVEIKKEINEMIDMYLAGRGIATLGGGRETDVTEQVASLARILGKA